MSNLIAFTPNDLSSLEDFVAESVKTQHTYLKYSKGEWLAGMEESVIDDTEQFAVDMRELRKGFICWKDNAPAGEVMRPLIGGQPARRSELEEIPDSDGWQEQASVVLRSMESGEMLEFKTSSKGGVSALGELVKEFTDRARRGDQNHVPVVVLKSTSYKHKAYGKVYKPVLEVVDWLGIAPLVEREPGEDDVPFSEAEVEAAPPKRRSRLAS
jgi:hypothetical protein